MRGLVQVREATILAHLNPPTNIITAHFSSINNRNIKLTDCLASFCATEELTGEDRYRCTQCDALNDCRKTFKITRLPETLCIHLKRFRYDSYSSKINTYVQFPMEDLDMTPFLKSTDHQELSNSKYDLYAMVRHRGVVGGNRYYWDEFDSCATRCPAFSG